MSAKNKKDGAKILKEAPLSAVPLPPLSRKLRSGNASRRFNRAQALRSRKIHSSKDLIMTAFAAVYALFIPI